jgi:hypothetical protein
MVNKALRTEDVQKLHTFRFYINDLSSTLAEEYKNRQMGDDQMRVRVRVRVSIKLYLSNEKVQSLSIFIPLVHETILAHINRIYAQLTCSIEYERLNRKDH